MGIITKIEAILKDMSKISIHCSAIYHTFYSENNLETKTRARKLKNARPKQSWLLYKPDRFPIITLDHKGRDAWKHNETQHQNQHEHQKAIKSVLIPSQTYARCYLDKTNLTPIHP